MFRPSWCAATRKPRKKTTRRTDPTTNWVQQVGGPLEGPHRALRESREEAGEDPECDDGGDRARDPPAEGEPSVGAGQPRADRAPGGAQTRGRRGDDDRADVGPGVRNVPVLALEGLDHDPHALDEPVSVRPQLDGALVEAGDLVGVLRLERGHLDVAHLHALPLEEVEPESELLLDLLLGEGAHPRRQDFDVQVAGQGLVGGDRGRRLEVLELLLPDGRDGVARGGHVPPGFDHGRDQDLGLSDQRVPVGAQARGGHTLLGSFLGALGVPEGALLPLHQLHPAREPCLELGGA